MGNATSIEQLLTQLEAANDPAVAYFSYTTDDKGERGMIHANKEGLRLYALDLLKKSMQMENQQDNKNLCFGQNEWLVSEAGYNLISGVKPAYGDRESILKAMPFNIPSVQDKMESDSGRNKGCLGIFLILVTGFCTLWAAFKCFS